MPVEIKELVIRTTVSPNAAASGQDDSSSSGAAPTGDATAMERIVQECVRQVMRILAKDRER